MPAVAARSSRPNSPKSASPPKSRTLNGHSGFPARFAGNYDLTIVSHTEPFDIGAFAKPGYYFGYESEAFNAIIAELNDTTDPDKRTELLKQAQTMLAEDYAAAFLFELAKTGVANAKIVGLWENSPVQANDLTGVYWED